MQKNINALVKKLRHGQSEYFNEFYDATKTAVFFTINKIVNNRTAAEDIMQETYVSFINNLHIIDDNRNAYSYLLTTAKNKAINEYKKIARVDYIDFLEDLPYEQGDLDAPLLNYAKEKLTSEEWDMLERTVVLGYRRVEVAKQLNKPISTVNWQYNQVLKKVQKFYKEVYNEKN